MIDEKKFSENPNIRIRKAYQIAKIAHENQVDKAGANYIDHPMTVASNVGEDESAIIVALLHDFLEDFLTVEERRALLLLTHESEIPYEDYVRRISKNPLARKVKLADLKHNMDLSRIANPTQKDLDRIAKKYIPARKILLEEEGN